MSVPLLICSPTWPEWAIHVYRCNLTDLDRTVFGKLFAWNNGKGAVCLDCEHVELQDMLFINNVEAGVELSIPTNVNPSTYSSFGPIYTVSDLPEYHLPVIATDNIDIV